MRIRTHSAGAFWQVLREQPEVAAVTLKRLTANVRDLSERVFEFSTLTVNNRIQAELLRLALAHLQDGEAPAVIAPAPTHAEIASRVSTTRETVARALSQLYPTGLVRRKGKSLYILDRDKFEQMLTALQLEGGGHHHA